MRIAQVKVDGELRPVVVTADDRFLDLRSIASAVDGHFLETELPRLVSDLTLASDLPVLRLDAPDYCAPVSRPGKIVCIGLNFADHAAESGMPSPEEPIVFFKASNTLVGPDDDVRVPRSSLKTDWEVELGVVLGAECRYVGSPEEAWSRIAGFVISNDVSEREFQLERGGQWVNVACRV